MGETGIGGTVLPVLSPAIVFVLGRFRNRANADVIEDADCESKL